MKASRRRTKCTIFLRQAFVLDMVQKAEGTRGSITTDMSTVIQFSTDKHQIKTR